MTVCFADRKTGYNICELHALLAQLVERCTCNAKVTSSTLVGSNCFFFRHSDIRDIQSYPPCYISFLPLLVCSLFHNFFSRLSLSRFNFFLPLLKSGDKSGTKKKRTNQKQKNLQKQGSILTTGNHIDLG